MVSKKLSSIEQITQHIESGNNFVLNGGAGSGKTRSLTDVIRLLHSQKSACKIACITFTNVAADEISKRVSIENINIRASTIHDFLWDVIKNYQKNLKQILLELINSNDIRYSGEKNLNQDWFKDKTINYREWRKLEEGVVSHDEILKLANKLFEKYPLIRRILSDKYDFILIDEYQDTEEQVIQIFLDYMQEENRAPVIGLFGDSMQSIYNKGIGDLQKYIDDNKVKEVLKIDNWRCGKNIISLINNIRNDGLKQEPSGEKLDGKIVFLHSNEDQLNFKEIKKHEAFLNFDFNDHKENKVLYLTHKLIAKQCGFENILNSYRYKENLTGDNPDKLAKHLFSIQSIIFLYENNRYNEFLKKTDFKIRKNSDLKKLKENIDTLKNSSGKNIEEVMKLANKLRLVQEDDSLKHFMSENEEQYNEVKKIPYREIINLFKYRNENSPYSTQHGVKGAEFNNVLVVLDNGRWNQYNFTSLFEGTGKDSIISRTRKIFYVSCSRAKKNLVVFFHKPTNNLLHVAEAWFGRDNVFEV